MSRGEFCFGGFEAKADVLYDNGPVNGELNGFDIDIAAGYSVTDSFSLTSTANVTGVDLAVWVLTGDSPLSVDWAITTSPFAGVIASGSGATLSGADLGTNETDQFDVFSESFSLDVPNLAAGNYYLQLSNADVSTSGDPVYWDENDGSSVAYQTPDGTAGSDYSLAGSDTNSPGYGITCPTCSGSETFSIVGAAVPEPGTVTTLLSGLVLMAPGILQDPAQDQPLKTTEGRGPSARRSG